MDGGSGGSTNVVIPYDNEVPRVAKVAVAYKSICRYIKTPRPTMLFSTFRFRSGRASVPSVEYVTALHSIKCAYGHGVLCT